MIKPKVEKKKKKERPEKRIDNTKGDRDLRNVFIILQRRCVCEVLRPRRLAQKKRKKEKRGVVASSPRTTCTRRPVSYGWQRGFSFFFFFSFGFSFFPLSIF